MNKKEILQTINDINEEIEQLDMNEPTADLELQILMERRNHQEYLLYNPELK